MPTDKKTCSCYEIYNVCFVEFCCGCRPGDNMLAFLLMVVFSPIWAPIYFLVIYPVTYIHEHYRCHTYESVSADVCTQNPI